MAANLKLGPHAPVIESTQTVDSNDSIPEVSRFNGHSVYAENGDRIAYIQLASRNDGRREYNMYVRNPYVDGEVFHGLKWGFTADASFYAQLTQGPVTSSHFLRSKSLRNSVSSVVRSPCAWHKGRSSSFSRKSPWLMENQDLGRHYQHSQKNSRSRRP